MLTALVTFESPSLAEPVKTLIQVGEAITIGTSKAADFEVAVPSLSGIEIRLSHLRRGLFIETPTDNERFTLQNREMSRARLKDGDELIFGQCTLFIALLGTPEPTTPQPDNQAEAESVSSDGISQVTVFETDEDEEHEYVYEASCDSTKEIDLGSDDSDLNVSSTKVPDRFSWSDDEPSTGADEPQIVEQSTATDVPPLSFSDVSRKNEVESSGQNESEKSVDESNANQDDSTSSSSLSGVDLKFVLENEVLFRYKFSQAEFKQILEVKDVFRVVDLMNDPSSSEEFDLQQINKDESETLGSGSVFLALNSSLEIAKTHLRKNLPSFRSPLGMKTRLTVGSVRKTKAKMAVFLFAAVAAEEKGQWDLFSLLPPKAFLEQF